MAVATSTIAAISLGVAAVGTQQQIRQNNIARSNANKAQRVQERIQRFQAARERRKQINAALRAQGQVVNQVGSAGVQGSSAAVTQSAAPGAQAASNIGAQNAINSANQEISLFNQRQGQALSNAQTAGAVTNLASQAFSLTGESLFTDSNTTN